MPDLDPKLLSQVRALLNSPELSAAEKKAREIEELEWEVSRVEFELGQAVGLSKRLDQVRARAEELVTLRKQLDQLKEVK